MDRVLYRKLTRKSKLGFGRYHDMTVGDLLNCMGYVGKDYLRWCYFNCSNITFFDDILDELEIPEEFRFTKPGSYPEDYENYVKERKQRKFNEIYGELDDKEKLIALTQRKIRKLNGRKMHCLRSELSSKESAGSMQWKNQGHKEGE